MPTPNQADYTDTFTVINADGELAAVATVNAAVSDITLNYKTSATGSTTSTALTALAAATTAHTDNRGFALGPGVLRVDFPDAPWATGASKVWAWLTFAGGLAGYEQAGGQKTLTLGYGLQNPDSGATELARSSEIDDVDTALTTIDSNVDAILVDTGTTLQNAITTIDSNVDAILVDTGTTLNDAITTLDTNVDSIVAKLPSASAKMAGEGATAKNLDQVTGGDVTVAGTLTDWTSTAAAGNTSTDELVLADFPATPLDYVGYIVQFGSQQVTITGYGLLDEEDGYSLAAELDPYPSVGASVTLLGEVRTGLVKSSTATSSDVASGGGPAMLDQAGDGFIVDAPRRRDGVLTCDQPIYLAFGETPICGMTLAKRLPRERFTSMETPVSSDTNVVTVNATAITGYGAEPEIAKFRPLVASEGVADGATATISFFATTTTSGRKQYHVTVIVRQVSV